MALFKKYNSLHMFLLLYSVLQFSVHYILQVGCFDIDTAFPLDDLAQRCLFETA